MYGLARDANRRHVLGEDVELVIEACDETNRRIRSRSMISRIKKRGGRALVCLVGVQSNQFPRAIDLARPFLAAGCPVIVGGFHVSGCVAMLPELPSELREAVASGVSLFLGEAEDGRLDEVLRDAWHGTLKPIYNFLENLPDLEAQPLPFLPASEINRSYQSFTSFDLGRGCPYQCSFCTIINVQGRKSRFRTADDLEQIIRENAGQGIQSFFITDDNFARNARWESFFDRLIHLRESENLRVKLMIQVDTLCHKIPNFIEKAKRAGVRRAFIGLENINPNNLVAAKKQQNKITEYRTMLQSWYKNGICTWAGYIIGFPADTKESVLRDIEIIKKELPTDVLEFFVLTPLPGSEDHRKLLQQGAWMDSDLNKYNTHDRVSHHPRMTDREWGETYDAAWRSYYSPQHMETIARRHAALEGDNPKRVMRNLIDFKAIYELEEVHPLEGGIFRLKYRTDRRPGLPLEWPGIFHLKLVWEVARKTWMYIKYNRLALDISRRVSSASDRYAYTDMAIMPAADEDMNSLKLFTETAGGEAAVERRRAEDRRRAIFGKAHATGR
jgi:radical SAM family protein